MIVSTAFIDAIAIFRFLPLGTCDALSSLLNSIFGAGKHWLASLQFAIIDRIAKALSAFLCFLNVTSEGGDLAILWLDHIFYRFLLLSFNQAICRFRLTFTFNLFGFLFFALSDYNRGD